MKIAEPRPGATGLVLYSITAKCGVRRRLQPQRLAPAVERWRRPAVHVAEAVVRRGRRVLVPPVAAHEDVVGEARAGVGDDRSAGRCMPNGEAIDVNPVENPYLEGGKVLPPAGRRYVDRTMVRPGMAVPDGTLVETFAAAGWKWGGRWTASPDWQHFSATGG
jgi:D-alanyl-D-alanine carboxypeptidase